MKKMNLIAAAFLLILAGCAGKSASSETAAAGGYNGAYYTEDAEYDAAPAQIANESVSFEDLKEESDDPVLTSEKLVYSGSLTVQTLKYDETVSGLRNYIHSNGGIVEYEYEYDTDYNWYTVTDAHTGTRHLNLTVRIPTEKFETFMNDMDGYGKVVSRSSSVENITRRYNDVSVQIEALEIQQARLLEMMDKAETIEDMILVEQRLTEVQTSLNSYKTQRESMDTDVKYSTVTMTVDEVKEYSDTHPNFFQQIGEAFKDGMRSFFYNTEDLLIAFVYMLPYLVILGIIIFFLVKKQVFKNFHPFRRRKNRFEEKKEKEIL